MASNRRTVPLVDQLKEIVPEGLAKYILWEQGISYKDKDQAYMLKSYLNNITPEKMEEWRTREDYNQAIKHLNKLSHARKMNSLYSLLYDQASKGDIQSIKAFTDFSKLYFEDKENEFYALLNGIEVDEETQEYGE